MSSGEENDIEEGDIIHRKRLELFERIASIYDLSLDILSLGSYAPFLRHLIKLLDVKDGQRVLDVCSGTGRATSLIAQRLNEKGEVIGIDMAENMVKYAQKRLKEFKNAKFIFKDVGEDLNYNNYFDRIFISFCLHELDYSTMLITLRSIHRWLKVKGKVLICDYNNTGNILLRLWFKIIEPEYGRYFLDMEIGKALENTGFKVVWKKFSFMNMLQVIEAEKV